MPTTNAKPNMLRRRLLQWMVGIGVSTVAAAAYVRVGEPHGLSVDQLELPIKGLPATLDGTRLAQLSDIHLSKYFSADDLAAAIEIVRDRSPDWLVLTGDYVGNEPHLAEGLVEPLRSLSMPVHAVFGNHDYWSDNAVVTRFLRESGANILLNEGTEIAAGLWLAGVDDLWSSHPDIKAALRSVPTGASTILLSHAPDYFDTVLYEEAPIALQLSGHSHGGQVRLPTLRPTPSGHYSYAPVLPQYGQRYPIGLRRITGRYVYTNRGLGVWPIPYRLNCRPELTILTLRAA